MKDFYLFASKYIDAYLLILLFSSKQVDLVIVNATLDVTASDKTFVIKIHRIR